MTSVLMLNVKASIECPNTFKDSITVSRFHEYHHSELCIHRMRETAALAFSILPEQSYSSGRVSALPEQGFNNPFWSARLMLVA